MSMRTITDFPRNEAGLVDKFIGTAYDIVKYVADNLGTLEFIYQFLNTYGVLLTVDSIDELKATPTDGKYARVYTFSTTAGYGYTDYLYVATDTSGVIPNDPAATGSWVVVASSTAGSGGSNSPAYIPWVYAQGAALGGETTIAVPSGTVGVPFIVVEGYMNTVGYGFTFDVASLTVTLAQPLELGDEVVLLLTGTPAVPDNPNVSNWVQINWLYNGGYAVGGEQVIAIPYTFEAIPAIYKNGDRYYAGLADKSYTVDAANQRILLTEPLATNDRLIVQIGGESTTLVMSDRTIQEVGRSANVRDSEVILSTNTTQYLNGMKVVYDVVAQKIYGLPTLPTNVYINTVSNGQLTYSPGNITVDLLPLPESAETLRQELAQDTGSNLVYTKSVLADAVARSLTNKLFDSVSVKDFGAVGDWNPATSTGTNDSVAFQKAVTTLPGEVGRNVYVPPGNYLVSMVNLSSNVRIFGAGTASTLFQDETQTGNSSVIGTNFLGNGGSASVADNTVNISIENLQIKRTNRTPYASSSDVQQHLHLIYISATTNWKVLNCTLTGFNGDGIYVAGGFGTAERHNVNGLVANCVFNGVDNQNRNGISVIDSDGLRIISNEFRLCTNPTQPGPIDIEPNSNTFHRIRDIVITHNHFFSCRGSTAGLNVYIPNVAYTLQPTNIVFSDNIIDGALTTSTAVGVLVMHVGDADATRMHNVVIARNKISTCLRAFNVAGIRGIRIEDNDFFTMRGEALLGGSAAGNKNINVVIKNNLLHNVGYEDGRGIGIYNITDLIIAGNIFRDVGKGTDPRAGEAIIFKSGATGNKLTVRDNTFINEGRLVTSAITSSGYTMDSSSNYFGGNVYSDVPNKTFPAVFGNEASANWNPIVYGDTTEGTGTYTTQNGRYRIDGGYVHFRLNVVLTAHTGAGPMNISLPTKSAVNGANAMELGMVTGNIASAVGVTVCKVDGGTFGTTGRIRLYRADGGGNVNVTNTGTALAVEITGSYPYQP